MKTILVACGEAPCSVEATAVICGRDITRDHSMLYGAAGLLRAL